MPRDAQQASSLTLAILCRAMDPFFTFEAFVLLATYCALLMCVGCSFNLVFVMPTDGAVCSAFFPIALDPSHLSLNC